MSNVYLVYFSPTGGTEKALRLLADAWEGEKKTVDLSLRDAAARTPAFAKEDVCLVAVPSYGGRVPALAAGRIKELAGNGARAAAVVVYGNRAYEDTLVELCDLLTEAGFAVRAGAAAVAEHSIMRQYAKGRPDEADEKTLRGFSAKIKAALESEGPAPAFPGDRPYKQWGGSKSYPEADDTCVGCETCARLCPAGAIPFDAPSETDTAKCISCMRCIAVCPAGARSLDAASVAAMAERMKAVFATRKEPELFV